MIAMPWGIEDNEDILKIKLYDHLRMNGNLMLHRPTCAGGVGDPETLAAISVNLKITIRDTVERPMKWLAALPVLFTFHLPVVNRPPHDSIQSPRTNRSF